MTNQSTEYLQPPWHLHGHGLIVLAIPRIADISARWQETCSLHFRLIGRTIAGFYIGSYSTPLAEHEILPWSEWGNVLGYAKTKGKSGLFISAMATDSQAAYTAGREVWGLNKIMGDIRFEADENEGHAELRTETDHVRLEWRTLGPEFPFSRPIWFLTVIGGKMHKYSVRIPSKNRFCRIRLREQEGADFNSVSTGNYWGLRFYDARIEVNSPAAVHPENPATAR
ncbi:MAG: hypothetical protein C4527_16205 [Candidatus Omnitrophota bacterium]|jgi:hypothetical protein|nr:MAG: hypothetical protein C4527_16205 [Candidatus Omnitrophota bacterium]